MKYYLIFYNDDKKLLYFKTFQFSSFHIYFYLNELYNLLICKINIIFENTYYALLI